MEKKIKLTQEQADGIKIIMNGSTKKLLGSYFNNKGFISPKFSPLNTLAVVELMTCLFVLDSYEVIPQYNVGDWVINIHTGEIGQVEEIKKVEGALGNNERIIVNSTINYPHSLRHATPEEIQKEIECRWWNNHGREVWEIREGDILKNETHYPYFVTRGNRTEQGLERTPSLNCIFMEIDEIKSRFKVSCFVEQRLDK